MSKLDSRLNAYRADLAELPLKGRVEAKQFIEGSICQITAPLVGLHREPRFDSMQLTQALRGERVRVFDNTEGWAWVKLEKDGYVGYMSSNELATSAPAPTHRAAVPLTFAYPAPNIKSQPVIHLTLNAGLHAIEHDEKFMRLSDGHFVFAKHLKPVQQNEADFVAVAERFLHAPYLWGGKSVLGIDCSGLVQLSMQAAGLDCPRDSDMQEGAVGTTLPADSMDNLKRGDLVFWDGHVGIMTSSTDLLHANGFYMQVTSEPLREAIDRIAASYGRVTALKRIQ